MFTVNGNTLSGKIGNKFLVYFESSNNWLLLEEPAWYVFKNLQKKVSEVTLSKSFADRYKISLNESKLFIAEVSENIQDYSNIKRDLSKSHLHRKTTQKKTNIAVSHFYRMNGHAFSISFSSHELAYFVHPLLKDFQINQESTCSNSYQIYTEGKKIILEIKGKENRIFEFSQPPELKKQLFIEISNLIYPEEADNWISFIHASAITDQNKSIVLSSPSGSGKSTLSALLMNEGFHVLSDDFIPVSGNSGKAFPFPVSISIKNAALPVLSPIFPELAKRKYSYEGIQTEFVKLLPINPPPVEPFKSFPVKHVVFLEFKPEADMSLAQLSQDEAFQHFFDNAKIVTGIKAANQLIKWFVKIPCFKLQYHDPLMACHEIFKLFK
ncbi:MAG: hypothetical protein H6538_01190 [Bacteroidales bacterium]|nr:hypothetical protein [Bacteroidales bacterium]MCB8999833.1 hypothetical protein [Bacteroidales bacterium]MCB9012657.1 hypothetical protein [Bacteroidales bacterium]